MCLLACFSLSFLSPVVPLTPPPSLVPTSFTLSFTGPSLQFTLYPRVALSVLLCCLHLPPQHWNYGCAMAPLQCWQPNPEVQAYQVALCYLHYVPGPFTSFLLSIDLLGEIPLSKEPFTFVCFLCSSITYISVHTRYPCRLESIQIPFLREGGIVYRQYWVFSAVSYRRHESLHLRHSGSVVLPSLNDYGPSV